MKQLYDHAKTATSNRTSCVPDELVVEHMDEEQIWQQLELQNEFLWSRCLKVSGKLLSGKDEAFKLSYNIAGEEDDDDDEEVDDEGEEDDFDGEEEESELGSDDDEDAESDDNDDDESNEVDNDDNGDNDEQTRPRRGRKSVVDDKFFKLSEMEEFLEAEDRKELQKHSQKRRPNDADDIDDDIDYFKASSDESGDEGADANDENYNYADFYGGAATKDDDDDDDDGMDERTRIRKMVELKNKKKLKAKKEDLGLEDSDIDEDDAEDEDEPSSKVKFDMSKNSYRSDSDRSDKDEDDDDDADAKPSGRSSDNSRTDPAELSTQEHRQERLRLRIQDMEDQAMGEKPWQLRGEINSDSRPQNSLLEEVLEFDSTVRPAPVITEETTLRLEDIIRQRIKDKAWNDVERKFKPVNTPQEFRKKLVLDQEKSKESLAQIYEKEYLKEVDKLKPDGGADGDRDAEEPKAHTEIRALMKEVFGKLDALANFFYTPKVAQADVRIITNIPAINMEEVAPVSISDAALLAPEEVRPRDKGDAVGKSERTQTDKNRERRQKKQKQREIGKAKERKEAERAAKGVVSSSAAEKKKLLAKVSKSRNVLKVSTIVAAECVRAIDEFG